MSAQLAAHGRLDGDPRSIETKTGRAMATATLAVDAADRREGDDESVRTVLLADVREYFAEVDSHRITSADYRRSKPAMRNQPTRRSMSCREPAALPSRSSQSFDSAELTVYDEVSDEDRSEVSAALAARLAEIRKGLTATLPGRGPDGEIPDHEVRLEAVGRFVDLMKMIQSVRPT